MSPHPIRGPPVISGLTLARLGAVFTLVAKKAFATSEQIAYIAGGAFAVCSSRGNEQRSEADLLAYTPQHVANFFLDKAEEDGVALDPMKLIKLVYIGYGWNLALTGQKLFDEEIQAWAHGPVIPSIYHEFKRFGSRHIEGRSERLDLETWNTVIPEIKPGDAQTRLILDKVWAAYRKFSGWALRNKTHEPGAPWTKVYNPSRKDVVIPDEEIAAHFKARIRQYLDAAKAAA